MDISIKQIAQDCGVSQESIRKWCKRNHVPKVGNRWNLNTTDVEAIYAYYVVEVPQLSEPKSEPTQPSSATFGTSKNATIDILREQLRVKDEQLRAKDEQIASLGEQLSQTTKALLNAQEQIGAAQLLHAADRKDDLLPKPQEQSEEKPRQGFFVRLFGR